MKNTNKSKTIKGRPVWKAGLLALLLAAGAWNMQAQEAEGDAPKGKPIIVLYTDYTAGLKNADDATGFNLKRSRFGYEYSPIQSLKATVAVDVNSSGGSRGVYFHYAMLEWEYKKLKLSGGLIGLSQFSVQEAFWKRRYIEKTFLDLNVFGYASDVGVIAEYSFADWIEADLTVTNGDGAKSLNHNKENRYGAGVTVRPVEGLTLRAYADTYRNTYSIGGIRAVQQTLALFAGYGNEQFSVGAEYNYQKDRQLNIGSNYSGFSVYADVQLWEKGALFARYDYMDEPDIYGWQQEMIYNNMLIAGLDIRPLRQLSISPNYRYQETFGGVAQHLIALNVGFSW